MLAGRDDDRAIDERSAAATLELLLEVVREGLAVDGRRCAGGLDVRVVRVLLHALACAVVEVVFGSALEACGGFGGALLLGVVGVDEAGKVHGVRTVVDVWEVGRHARVGE